MTLGIAIPSHKGHASHLNNLLNRISESTILPNQVSISISSLDEEMNFGEYPFELIMTQTPNFKNASENRNIAASKLTTDIISFIDSDDLPHPKRNEYIIKSFNLGSKIALHDYEAGQISNDYYNNDIGPFEVFKEYVDTFISDRHYPTSSKGHQPYANGHVSISSEIFKDFKFDEDPSLHRCCEDSEYNSRLVKNGYKICYIKNKLSNYRS
jgi:hypothetical protein